MKTVTAITVLGLLVCLPLYAAEAPPAGGSLFKAIWDGDLAAVQKLLKEGTDLNARNSADDTPLMAAAVNGNVATVDLLVKAGADVNATTKAGVTPLLRAATFEEKVQLLVARGADVKARSRFGNTALLLAARKPGNSAAVKFLLDRGADPDAANVLGATPLMAAAAAGDNDTVRVLLDRGADINAKPNIPASFGWGGGRTALMWAAFQGNESMATLLLERGAKVNDFCLGSALTQAAWGGHVGIARLLLDAGAQVDQRDVVAHYTPLHWAASSEFSSPALVELLLARGADVNAEGGQPVDNFLGATYTPLALARRRGNTPIVQALLKAGAKDAPDSGDTRKSDDRGAGLAGARSAAESIQLALPTLTRTAELSVPVYLRHVSNQDCIACHQQQLPLAAMSLAHSRKIATDREVARHQVELLNRSFWIGHIKEAGEGAHNILEMDLQTTFHPEPAIYDGYVAMNLNLEHQPASEVTDSMVHQLATIQFPDGHWDWNLPRAPIQASNITATASAIETIVSFTIPARKQELDQRVQRARSWLAQANVETNQEHVHQLLGLAWAGENPDMLGELAADLIHQQRIDGGWAQLAGLESDAYATGQSLYALMEAAKIPATDPSVCRGLDFLLSTQHADGTWLVHTRAHPFQPPMDSGFPHGRDSWISSAATSWAVMAIALSLDPAQTPQPAIAATATPAVPPPVADHTAVSVDFARDIQPLLERSCVACHSGEKPKGGLRLTDRASLLKGGNRGEPVVVPGKPDASELLRLVQDQVEDLEMPPLAKRGRFPALAKDQITKLGGWIAQGAVWPDGLTLAPPAK